MTEKEKPMSVSEDLVRRSYGLEVQEAKSEVEGKEYLKFIACTDRPFVARREIMPGVRANVSEVTDFKGLDETRLKKGLALLDSHDDSSTNKILGKIVEYKKIKRGDDSMELEVKAEFDMSIPESKSAYEKAKAGLINYASIGYGPIFPNGLDIQPRSIGDDFDINNDIAADVTLTSWEIDEISFVARPADPRAELLGRSYGEHYTKSLKGTKAYDTLLAKSTPASTGDITMTEETIKEAPAEEAVKEAIAEAVADSPVETKAAEKTEVKEAEAKFTKSGSSYIAKNAIDMVKAGAGEEFVKSLADKAEKGLGMTEAAVKAELWDHLQTKDTETMKDIGKGQAPAVHTKSHTFSFDKVLRQLKKGRDNLDGKEQEMIREFAIQQEGRKNAPQRMNEDHSVMIPLAAYVDDPMVRGHLESWGQKRYDVGTPATSPAQNVGYNAYHTRVFDESWVVDRLVNRATVLPFVSRMPSQLFQDKIGVTIGGSVAVGHVTQNATRAESTGLTLGNRSIEYKLAFARQDFSQQSLDQSRYLFGTVLDKMQEDMVREIDRMVLIGTNSGGQPQGITGFSNLVSNDIGTNGGDITYEKIVGLIAKLEAQNVNLNGAKFVITPEVKAKLRTIQRQAGATGGSADVVLSHQHPDPMPNIDGYPVITTNVTGGTHPNTLKARTKGTGTNLHALIFGRLETIQWGHYSATEVAIDPYSAMETGQTRVYVRLAYGLTPDHQTELGIIGDIDVS